MCDKCGKSKCGGCSGQRVSVGGLPGLPGKDAFTEYKYIKAVQELATTVSTGNSNLNTDVPLLTPCSITIAKSGVYYLEVFLENVLLNYGTSRSSSGVFTASIRKNGVKIATASISITDTLGTIIKSLGGFSVETLSIMDVIDISIRLQEPGGVTDDVATVGGNVRLYAKQIG